jgi:catechol 2,3-dioxygenase-like lactoylglutathione lyase family enzyme
VLVTLFVEDLERSRLFYQDVFGLGVIFEDEDSAAFEFGTRSSICSASGGTRADRAGGCRWAGGRIAFSAHHLGR